MAEHVRGDEDEAEDGITSSYFSLHRSTAARSPPRCPASFVQPSCWLMDDPSELDMRCGMRSNLLKRVSCRRATVDVR